MSRTEMYTINTDDGTPTPYTEYRNAHGWAAFVWTQLCAKHRLNDFAMRRDQWPGVNEAFGEWKYLWHKHEKGELGLAVWEHNVLMSTYDWAFVGVDDFESLASSLRMFHTALGHDRVVCHLRAMADDIDAIDRDRVMGICWYGMSVGEDLWFTYNSGVEGYVPYNFKTQDRHNVVDIKPFSLLDIMCDADGVGE